MIPQNGEEGISAAIKNFIDIVKSIAIPIFEGLRYAFDKIKGAVSDNKDSFEALFKFMKEYVAPFFGGAMKLAIEALGTALSLILGIVGKVISAFRTLIDLGSKVAGFVGGVFGGGKASGGSVSAGTTYLVGEKGPELFTAGSNGAIIPNNAISSGGGNTVNITVNGAVDPISTARQIANLLNKEATLSGSFNRVGASLLVGA
jgi:predicted RecA/RadA family phage recombinase